MTRLVAVSGPGQAATPEQCDIARDVGRLLAEHGFGVVTGGLDGVMAAAALGAREGGGLALGVLPGDDASTGNEHLTLGLPTGLGELRNGLLVRMSLAVIAVGASWGTLSEVALARRTAKPVVWIHGWHLTDADGRVVDVMRAENAQLAVRLAIEAIDGRASIG